MSGLDQCLSDIEKRWSGLEERWLDLDQYLSDPEKRLSELEERLLDIEKRLSDRDQSLLDLDKRWLEPGFGRKLSEMRCFDGQRPIFFGQGQIMDTYWAAEISPSASPDKGGLGGRRNLTPRRQGVGKIRN